MGTGRANIMWPGLNSRMTTTGKEFARIQVLPPNPDFEKNLMKQRQLRKSTSRKGVAPLLRGWTGAWVHGTSAGQPDPINNYHFTDFDSRILQLRLVSTVTGTLGKKFSFSCFVAVGNKKGLAGFGHGKSTTAIAATRIAKNRAAQNLMFIPMYEDHTVYHNIFSQFHRSKIFVHKKRKGYGLKCHRAIKTVCELIGLKDLHVKVEGSTKNTQAVVKGFFQALLSQESHQELADRMKLHVVESRPERGFLPTVVASPIGEVSTEPVKPDSPIIDTHLGWLYSGDKYEYSRPPPEPFYAKTRSYRRKQWWRHENRNQVQAQMLRRAGLW